MESSWQLFIIPLIVATATAWVTASIRVGRSRKAERNDDALRAIGEAVRPYKRTLLAYQRGWNTSRQSTTPTRHGEDHYVVRAVVEALPDLHRWRRQLVERRARRMFGNRIFDVVEIQTGDAGEMDTFMRMNVAAAPSGDSPSPSMLWSTVHPPSTQLIRFLRELERLEAGW